MTLESMVRFARNLSQIEAAVLSIWGWHDGCHNAPKPRVDFITEALRWWDRWLKDIPNGAEEDPDYRVYIMDGIEPRTSYENRLGKWVGIPGCPPKLVEHQNLILGDGTLGGAGMIAALTVETNPKCRSGFGEYFPFGFGPGELPDDERQDDALSACFDTAAV